MSEIYIFFFFSSRRRHTRYWRDWSSDVCSSDLDVICVVEEPKDVVAIERTREFRGRYHVLGGAISPIEGIGPDDLRVKELMTRLMNGTVTELIIATDPRSEEHTSELQSRQYLVCRLLLEKQ